MILKPLPDTRGFRNNNPLNIIKTPNSLTFKGVSKEQHDKKFLVFEDLSYGLRAGMVILRNYVKKGFNTPSLIISRWAPPSDNNPTSIYAKFVAKRIKKGVDEVVDLNDTQFLSDFVKAIAEFENGKLPKSFDESLKKAITLL